MFNVNSDMNCQSNNLLYCITCSVKKTVYTGNKLCERIRIHRQQIRDPATGNIPVSKHLANCGGSQFIVLLVYKILTDNEIIRNSKEHFQTRIILVIL